MHEPDIAPRAPWLGRTTPKGDEEAGSPSIYLRWAGAFLMAAHGLIHLMGMVLLWKLTEPGQLTYAAAVPTPGTDAAYAVGALWLATAVVFVTAALLMVFRRLVWRWFAVAGVMLSGVVVGMQPSQTRVALVIDALILLAVGWAVWSEHRRERRAERGFPVED